MEAVKVIAVLLQIIFLAIGSAALIISLIARKNMSNRPDRNYLVMHAGIPIFAVMIAGMWMLATNKQWDFAWSVIAIIAYYALITICDLRHANRMKNKEKVTQESI